MKILRAMALVGAFVGSGAGKIIAGEATGNQTWKEAVADVLFSEKAKPGDEKYGYTYAKQSSPQWPSFTGWWRIVKQGTTPCWSDVNRDGKRDPGEIQPVRYCLYYYIPNPYQVLADLGDSPGPDGLYATTKYYLDQTKEGRPVSGIGQAAKFTPLKPGGNGDECRFVAGPLFVIVSARCVMVSERGSVENVLSEDPYWVKETTERLPERAALIETLKAGQAGAGAEVCRVAGEIAGAWNRWCEQKIADGPGLKGVFSRDPAWNLLPKDLPAGLASDGDVSNQRSIAKETSAQQGDGEKWEGTREDRYEISFRSIGRWSGPQDSVVNEPLNRARADFQQQIANLQRDYKSTGPDNQVQGPLPLTLAGAEEAVRFVRDFKSPGAAGQYSVYNSGETIVFRKANVVVVVNGWSNTQGLPVPEPRLRAMPHTAKLAALVLQKILATRGRPEVASATLTLTATPAALWADGVAQSTVRLTARDADGKPVAAEFELETEGGGKLSASRVRTNEGGSAEAVYTASTWTGEATVIAAGARAIASTKIHEGGLRLQQKNTSQLSVFADGRSKMELIVTCTDPAGRPLKGVTVKFTTDEKALPVAGRLEPATATTDDAGQLQLVYTAPAIDATRGFRAGNVYVTAVATLGTPAPREFKDSVRFQAFAGEVAFVEVTKLGFAQPAQFPVAMPGRNATIKGVLATRGFGDAVHKVASANVRILNADGRASAVVVSQEDGSFAVKFVGDPMSPKETTVELPEPLVLRLNDDLQNRLTEGRAALKHLAATGHEVSTAAGYLAGFPAQLAKSKPGHADVAQSTEYAVNVMPRVAWMSLYTKLASDRQTESVTWFLDSLEPVIKQVGDLVGGIDDLEKAAKEKLGAQFNAKVWKNMKETTVGRFLRKLNVWHRQNTKGIRRVYKAVDQLKEGGEKTQKAVVGEDEGDSEKGFTGKVRDNLQLIAEPMDYAKDQLQEATGTDEPGKKFTKYIKTAMTSLLRDNMEPPMLEARQAVLQACAEQSAKGMAPAGDYQPAAQRAKELFTTFEKEHNALNLANLDRELYRLDTNLFINSVVKGVFIYYNGSSLLSKEGFTNIRDMNPEKLGKIQESVTNSGDAVSKAADTLDSAFGLYKGKAWLDDLDKSAALLEQLHQELFPAAPAR